MYVISISVPHFTAITSLHLWLKALACYWTYICIVGLFSQYYCLPQGWNNVCKSFNFYNKEALNVQILSRSLAELRNEHAIIYLFICSHSTTFNLNALLPKTAAWDNRALLHVSLSNLAWCQSRQSLFLFVTCSCTFLHSRPTAILWWMFTLDEKLFYTAIRFGVSEPTVLFVRPALLPGYLNSVWSLSVENLRLQFYTIFSFCFDFFFVSQEKHLKDTRGSVSFLFFFSFHFFFTAGIYFGCSTTSFASRFLRACTLNCIYFYVFTSFKLYSKWRTIHYAFIHYELNCVQS